MGGMLGNVEPVLTVVAAVIERGDEVLICQRNASGKHALKWEFPGGKVEAGETPSQALARELDEELGIRATIDTEITRYPYQYDDRAAILLVFFRVREYAGELTNRQFAAMHWEKRKNLPVYDFLEGDVDFVRNLSRE